MLTFSSIFFVTFVYVVARGALDWGPLKSGRRVDEHLTDVVSSSRTVTSTIRRVGSDGRETEIAA
jgi:hypothetical protein